MCVGRPDYPVVFSERLLEGEACEEGVRFIHHVNPETGSPQIIMITARA